MLNRRTFLKSTALLAASAPLLGRGAASGAAITDAAAPKARPSAGLLFDAEDLPRIRANLELPRLAELRALIFPVDMAAQVKFLREELRLDNLIQDFSRARRILENASLAYVLSRDPEQLALARLALRRLCEYERWDYFLEGGKHTIGLQRASEATIATVLALDWLVAELSAEERVLAERSIVMKGAPACYLALYGMKYPDRVRGWTQDPRENMPFTLDMRRWPLILNATNLKVIPICGLGYASIALHGRHAEADKWLDLARQSARAFSVMYGLDGAYDEGVGYWGYTTMHLALFAEALYRRLGIDDRHLINYPGTIRYALTMSMATRGAPPRPVDPKKPYNATPQGALDPDKDIVNFGDSGLALDLSSAPWVARVSDDPLSAYAAREVGGLKQWPAAIWYRADAPARAPGPELHDVRLSNDIVVSRTGWGADDAVVALRSGGPSNHEHADRNSVVFKAYGERLFHDPARAAYATSSPRWLLRLTEAHTAVLIGGKGHQYHDGSEGTNSSWARAKVTDYRTGAGWMKVTSDATEAYQLVMPEVRLVERTVVFLKPDVLILLDRVQMEDPAKPLQLRFQVFNDDGGGAVHAGVAQFTITRPHAMLKAAVSAVGPVAVREGRLALPAEEGLFPFAEVESATSTSHEVLTVATARGASDDHGQLAITRDGATWRVRGSHGGQSVNIALSVAANTVPQLVV